MKRKIWYSITVLALVLGLALSAATPVSAQGVVISIELDPTPPGYILNDGVQVQGFRWTIQFASVPDYYTFQVRTFPDGVLIDTPETNFTKNISGQSSPVHNDEWPGFHIWHVPAGQPPGQYLARVTYYRAAGYEADAGRVFQIRQRVQVYKYNDVNGNGINDAGEPPLSGWDFDVTGPETWTGNSTDASGYLINSSTGYDYKDFLKSGTYTVTETLKGDWTNTDPGGSAPYDKTFTVPHPTGQTIVMQFGNRQLIPKICIDKTVDCNGDGIFKDEDVGYAGDNATWKVMVTNCGDSDLTTVTVTDTNGHDFGAAFDLAKGEYKEFNYQTKVDVDTTNNATVTATDILGGTVSDWDIATNLVISPKICIDKTVDCNNDGVFLHEDTGTAGDNATWKVVVTNCGDSDLTNVIVTDSNGHNFGPAFNLSYGAPPVEFTYITVVNVDTTNNATVVATDLLGGTVSDWDIATNLIRGGLATRTWGWWKTHRFLVDWAYDQGIWASIDMGTWQNYTRVNQTHIINSMCRYMGLMWSDQSKNSNRTPRYDIDVVRIHAAHQALAAIMNSYMPGGAPLPDGMTLASIAGILSSNNITAIGNLASILDTFNGSGETIEFDPSVPAPGRATGNIGDPAGSRDVGGPCMPYWNTPPKPRK